jgi:hypothetical protein
MSTSPPESPEAERELEAGDRLGARLICGAEPAFPPLLAALDPPPPLLWVLGEAGLLTRSGRRHRRRPGGLGRRPAVRAWPWPPSWAGPGS